MSTCDGPRNVPATPRPEKIDLRRLKQLAISESGFAFDPVSGLTFHINGTGLAAIRALNDGAAPQEVARLLGENHQTDPGDDIVADVEDFLSRLAAHGLLPSAGA